MKKYNYLLLWLLVPVMTLASCEVVGGIFKAGFWTAIILIVLVVGLILWLVGRGRR
ncbi:MAG TPA: phosphatidate cytidylyltransferase [Flavisolibacter sp.]